MIASRVVEWSEGAARLYFEPLFVIRWLRLEIRRLEGAALTQTLSFSLGRLLSNRAELIGSGRDVAELEAELDITIRRLKLAIQQADGIRIEIAYNTRENIQLYLESLRSLESFRSVTGAEARHRNIEATT